MILYGRSNKCYKILKLLEMPSLKVTDLTLEGRINYWDIKLQSNPD